MTYTEEREIKFETEISEYLATVRTEVSREYMGENPWGGYQYFLDDFEVLSLKNITKGIEIPVYKFNRVKNFVESQVQGLL